ncbi:LytR family transcriptional regulator, partial [Streptomyces sp. NPDC058989]
MDAQGRGRAGDDNVDPADQWVFDPNTGNYELRLDPAGQATARPSDRKAPGSRRAARQQREEVGDTDTRPLPTQRGRRGQRPEDGAGERPAGGRAAARRAAGRT